MVQVKLTHIIKRSIRACIALFCCLVAVTIVGCANAKAPKVQTSAEPQQRGSMPPIAVFSKQPSAELMQKCREFENESTLGQCAINVGGLSHEVQQLRDTQFFAHVAYGNREIPFALAISKVRFSDADAAGLASAFVSGASLLLVPTSITDDVQVEVDVYWRGTQIKQLSMSIPFKATMSLFTNAQQSAIDFAGALSAALVESIREENILSPQYLAAELKATDYANDLTTPAAVLPYRRGEDVQYGDPLEGAAISYIHPEFGFDEYEVFVYPIRQADWKDTAAVLNDSVALLIADLEIAQKEGHWKSVEVIAQAPLVVQTDSFAYSGIKLTTKMTDPSGDEFHGEYFDFTIHDKHVRIARYVPAVYAGPSSQQFVTELLNRMSVPPESLFLAKLRQRMRTPEFE